MARFSLEDLHALVEIEAVRQDLDPELAVAVATQESAFKPEARSPRGAIGVMQLMATTAKDLGVDPYNVSENIRGGVTYLKQQLDAFGDRRLALAAYNAGPGAVKKHGGVPPYKETRTYVQRILGMLTPATAEAEARQKLPTLPAQPPEWLTTPAETPPTPGAAAPLPTLPDTPPAWLATETQRPPASAPPPAPQENRDVAIIPERDFGYASPTIETLGPEVGDERTTRVLSTAGRVGMAMGINLTGELGGTALGAAVGAAVAGPPGAVAGGAIGSMVGSLGARRVNMALGLEEEGLGQDLLAVAPGAVPLALQGFRSILRGTAGARKLERTAGITAATNTAQAQKTRLSGLQTEAGDIAREATLQQQQLVSQTRSLHQAAREGMQARGQAVSEAGKRVQQGMQAGITRQEDAVTEAGKRLQQGMQEGVTRRGDALQEAGEGLQTAARARLGRPETGAQTIALARHMAQVGPEVTEQAIREAYTEVERYGAVAIPRDVITAAVERLPRSIRRGLAEVLSVIPPGQTITLNEVRDVQSTLSRTQRVLERAMARGEDIAAPARLRAVRQVREATEQALTLAERSQALPAEGRALLREANRMYRVQATFDRLDILREVHGTRVVGGEIVFDAQNFRSALRKDAALRGQLEKMGAYPQLDTFLARMAVAQRSALHRLERLRVPPLDMAVPSTKVPPLVENMPQFRALQQANRRVSREAVQLRTGRQEAVQGVTRATREGGRTVDETLQAQLDVINRQFPEVAPGIPLAQAGVGAIVGTAAGAAYGSPPLALALGATLGGLKGLSYYLLTPQGQRHLATFFASDPTVTTHKLRALVAIGRTLGGDAPEPPTGLSSDESTTNLLMLPPQQSGRP